MGTVSRHQPLYIEVVPIVHIYLDFDTRLYFLWSMSEGVITSQRSHGQRWAEAPPPEWPERPRRISAPGPPGCPKPHGACLHAAMWRPRAATDRSRQWHDRRAQACRETISSAPRACSAQVCGTSLACERTRASVKENPRRIVSTKACAAHEVRQMLAVWIMPGAACACARGTRAFWASASGLACRLCLSRLSYLPGSYCGMYRANA